MRTRVNVSPADKPHSPPPSLATAATMLGADGTPQVPVMTCRVLGMVVPAADDAAPMPLTEKPDKQQPTQRFGHCKVLGA